MEKAENKQYRLTICLFIIYLIVLAWIILFKLQFSISNLDYIRGVNLIPFGKSVSVNGSIQFDEIINNIFVFIPFGIYISMLKKDISFIKKIIPIISVSLIFEVSQYVFSIGATDITDLIVNTFGGIIGIGVYYLFLKILKNNKKTNRIINIIALIGTIIVIAFLALLLLVNS